MKLPPHIIEHKTLMIAILILARHVAAALKVALDAPIAEICQATGASRPSAYEQAERVMACLSALAEARPGRPPVAGDCEPRADEDALRLTVDTLSYQLDHPGSALPQHRRTWYAPAFQRFILTSHDAWQGTLESFAQAVRVPLDTLRDWLSRDQAHLMVDPEPKQQLTVPVDASETTHAIAAEWLRWDGPTRAFLGHAARSFRISPAQVRHVLVILGAISPRRRQSFRHRDETQTLSPGAMLVTDGKRVAVELTDSGECLHFNWQAMVDQATACDTAVVVTDEECAAGVGEAYQRSLVTLGGVVPDALLHDGKPCHDDTSLRQMIHGYGTTMIPATPDRPENKAVVEGAFGLFEQRVGTIRLDDSTPDSLARSAVAEAIRAYTAATNSVPRIELDGASRLSALHDACPSFEQKQRDRAFLANLAADHQPSNRWQRPPDPISLDLLDDVFARLGILDKDPSRSLRLYLARNEPEAIRRAAAVVSAKLQRNALDLRWVHRYLVKVIQNQQDELDLERAASELLNLCRAQNQAWTASEERDLQILVAECDDPMQLACAIAENAAHGGVPVQTAFWSDKLISLLDDSPSAVDAVIPHLVRLFEAPQQKRLALIDLITARQQAVA